MKEGIVPLPLRSSGPSAGRVLDLFSGIGGFALAFEAAGFETIAFAEIEPYPCKILKQHWPHVPNLGDVRTINGEDYAGVDVVCGGFPCQDISTAGKGAGIHGDRSGLWFEMLRIIRGSRPTFCLLENVPALRSRGADDVIDGLEDAGYAARPFMVGACNSGAPHLRGRAWVVAYAKGIRWDDAQAPEPGSDTKRNGAPKPHHITPTGRLGGASMRPWRIRKPGVLRVANGLPNRAHRIKALGNSIVPAVAYPFAVWIASQLTRSVGEAASAEPSK